MYFKVLVQKMTTGIHVSTISEELMNIVKLGIFFLFASGLICLVFTGLIFVGKGENAGPPPGFKGRDEQTKRRRASKAYQDDR